MTRTSSNGSAVFWSHDTDEKTRDNSTALLLVRVLVTCSGRIIILSIISVKNETIVNSNIVGENFTFSGFSGISLFSGWLRICKYYLFDTTNLIQNLIYTFWYRILYQFLVTGTSDLLYVSINSWDSQVLAYTPLSFFLYIPFKDTFSSLLLEQSSILREYIAVLPYWFIIYSNGWHICTMHGFTCTP